jgi:hypothetical protein
MRLTIRDELSLQRNELDRLELRMAALEKRVPVYHVLAAQQEAIASVFLDLRATIEALTRSTAGISSDAMARICLSGRVPLEQAVKLAVKHYCQTARDVHTAEMHLGDCKANSKFRPVLEDHCCRFRTTLEERHRLLLELGVFIIDVAPGEPVDFDHMILCDEVPTDNEQSAGTVVQAHTPAFRFRDALMNDQVIPAEVDVFVSTRRDEPNDPDFVEIDEPDESNDENCVDI